MTVTDASGSSVCVEPSIVTTSTGRYVCTLLAGKTAPFLVVVTDPSGGHAPLVSVATTTPAAGTPLVVNATPLTTAIVSQLVPGGDALALAETKTLVRDIDATALAALTSEVVMQLAPALSALGMPAGHDPFATPITAATASASGNTADKVIELLRFTTVNGVTTVATVDAPDARVPLTTLTGTAAPLPAPSASAASLADITHLLAAAFNKCFAVPAAGRIDSNYLHNGYRGGQHFYALFDDADMDGATFSPPERMRFADDTSPADRDSAILNLRYVDKNGTAGNLISLAVKPAGGWRPHGNQPHPASLPHARRQLQGQHDALRLTGAGTGRLARAPQAVLADHSSRSLKGLREERISMRSGVPESLKCSRMRPSR